MALPSTNFDLETIPAPSSDLTGFSPIIEHVNDSAGYIADINTTDGARGRIAKHSNGSEYAKDPIDFVDSTDRGLTRFYYGTILAASTAASRQVRKYPPNTRNTAYGVSDTYGQYNAYNASRLLDAPLMTDANDRTSNGNNGTAQGGVTIGGIAGKIATATQFDGIDDWIEFLQVLAAGETTFTLNWWYKGTDGTGTYLGQGNSGSSNPRLLNNHVSTFFSVGSSGFIDATTSDDIDDTWRMLSVTNSDIYIDGVSVESGSIAIDTGTYDNFGIAGFNRNGSIYNPNSGAFQLAQAFDENVGTVWLTEEYSQTNDNATFWGTWTWTSAGGDLSIVAESGTFTQTGTAAGVLADRIIAAVSGVYTWTGSDADLIVRSDAFVDAESGTFLLTGTIAATIADRILGADSGTFTLVGSDVDFIIVAEAVITADSGNFSWNGSSVELTRAGGEEVSIIPVDQVTKFNFKVVDLGIAIARDDLEGVGRIEKYGKRVGAAATDVVQDEGGTIDIETSASTIELISTSTDDDAAGSGAEAFYIVGVDVNWNPIEETIVTNGTTVSLSSGNSFLYVYRAQIVDSGAQRNAGDITIRRSGAGATLATVLTGKGQTQKAVFPVPAGCSVYMKKFRFEGSKTGVLSGEINLMEYPLGEGIRVAHPIVFSSGEKMTVEWDAGVKEFTEKTLVWVEVESISTGAIIAASFDGVIVRHSDSTP